MNQFWKAVRPDGTDFYTGMVQWAPPEDHEGEWIVRHPTATEIGDHASKYLSVATVPTDCTNMDWPCRLLTVEAVGGVATTSEVTPNKRAGVAFRVTGERTAYEALGPQGEHVAAMIDRASRLTVEELEGVDAAWVASRYVATDAARVVATVSARYTDRIDAMDAATEAATGAAGRAATDAARYAACDAAMGLAMRDLISADHYGMLTRPWRTVVGPIHPDDEPLTP